MLKLANQIQSYVYCYRLRNFYQLDKISCYYKTFLLFDVKELKLKFELFASLAKIIFFHDIRILFYFPFLINVIIC